MIPSKEHEKRNFELMDVNAQIDSDVSSKGECQIKNLAQQLEKDDFITKDNDSLIAHSPLKRARQTCKGMFGFKGGYNIFFLLNKLLLFR